MPELDVYRDWLQIADEDRPLNYYQLLRLKKFEDDVGKIRGHYRKMNAHVRKYATGDYANQSQELLNELAKAMLCLTDLGRKQQYDESLGRAAGKTKRKRTVEEILVGRGAITAEQLAKAKKFADALGLDVRDAVVQQKMVTAEIVTQAFAESLGLPYVELGDVGVDEKIVPKIPTVLARQHSCAPVMIDDGQLLMASPMPILPEVEEELRLRLQVPVRSVLCTPADIHTIIERYYSREALHAEKLRMAEVHAKAAAKAAQEKQSQPEKSGGGVLSRLLSWKKKG